MTADWRTIRLLIVKDWQLYQKQLAGYVAGMVLALSLAGTGEPWTFAAGGLLLIVLLVSTGYFSIQGSLLLERKEQTVPFIMSLPVSPMEFFWGKLLGNFAIYLAPFTLVTGGTALLILLTPLPDGLLVYALLVYGFMLMSFCVALSVAIAVESEGWNVFAMMALMTMLGPFMYAAGRLVDARADRVVWNWQANGVLAAELLVIAAVLGVTSWVHSRKTSFL